MCNLLDDAGVWIEQVCQQIRCKAAREVVANELKGHMEKEKVEQKKEFY